MRVFSEKQRTTHLLKLYQSERFLKDIEQERAIRNWLEGFRDSLEYFQNLVFSPAAGHFHFHLIPLFVPQKRLA